jgi:hypothetical protein
MEFDVHPILDWLEATTPALFVQQSDWAFPAIESVHVIAIVLVVGTIAIVDLRLLGIPTNQRAVTEIARDCLPWTWGAFGLAVISGSLMFIANAGAYYENFPFRMKMLVLLAAGLNMLVFELITVRTVAHWDRDRAVPLAGKVAATLSLAFWIAAVAFGRWIGFTLIALPF